jgi:hypothetical protein
MTIMTSRHHRDCATSQLDGSRVLVHVPRSA